MLLSPETRATAKPPSPTEAMQARVFRAQLEKTPRNGWSLFGLGASLVAQGKAAEAEAVAADFDDAWQLADVTLPAATF
jgi:hypothetical protein